MRSKLIISLALLGAVNAQAANKCTGADGKISYQDGPCAGAAKAAAVEIQPSQRELENLSKQQWRFSKERDPMTNEVMCFASSSEVLIPTRAGYRYPASVRLQYAANQNTGGSTLTVRTRPGETSGIFHVNTQGMGIKADTHPFTPITTKISQHAVGFESSNPASLLTSLMSAKEARLRVRLWPYDELIDTDPISMRGAQQALQSAMQCAASR